MATTQPRAGGLEVRSIDYVPLSERHGKVWHLGPLWFMSNAQVATLAVGLISITEGASLFWSVLAATGYSTTRDEGCLASPLCS